jgi:hypothetical protein
LRLGIFAAAFDGRNAVSHTPTVRVKVRVLIVMIPLVRVGFFLTYPISLGIATFLQWAFEVPRTRRRASSEHDVEIYPVGPELRSRCVTGMWPE